MKKLLSTISLAFVLATISTFALGAPAPTGIHTETSVVGQAINFGSVPVGSFANVPVNGTNDTPAELRIWAILSGPDAGQFSVVNNCGDSIVIPGILCTGTVSFHPSSPGAKDAVLIIVARGTWGKVGGAGADVQIHAVATTENTLVWTQTIVLSGTGN